MSTGYTEGKHDDPAPGQDRLVRVGTKFQATAPAVADGDNVYLLVDAAGRLLIAGAVASDAVEAGNPIMVGGSVDDTSPAAAAEGDARRFRSTPEGNQIVELYKDNSALLPISAMPGASEVKQQWLDGTDNSAARETVITPTAGKKVRIISIDARLAPGTTLDQVHFYFGTGATITTTPTKAIGIGVVDDTIAVYRAQWPDGGGPIGAVDDVVSMKKETAVAGEGLQTVITYREE